jgi:hypothetical protein
MVGVVPKTEVKEKYQTDNIVVDGTLCAWSEVGMVPAPLATAYNP